MTTELNAVDGGFTLDDAQQQVNEANEGVETPAEDTFAVFGGDALKVEPRRRDAHLGTILAITRFDSPNTGSPAIQVQLQSANTGATDEWTVFVPRGFAENCGKFMTGEMTSNDLFPGEPDPERPGKLKGNQRAQYGMSIKNTAGDAAVQQILSVISKHGRRPEPGTKIEDFDAYIQLLSNLATDLTVIYTRTPQTTEDNPRGFLHVNRIYFPADILDENGETKPKKLANYVKHWEQQTEV